MRGELIPVPVPGADALMAVQANGRAWAALKPMCDSLGIDFSRQLRKLKGRSWATVVQRSTVANDGRTREMVFVDSRTIPMWLAIIDEHRVAEEAKPKLIAYQREAAEALDAYFNQRVSNVPAVNQFDVLRAAIDQIEAAQREASEAKALAQRTEARLDGIEGRHDWLSALAYSKIHGLHTSEAPDCPTEGHRAREDPAQSLRGRQQVSELDLGPGPSRAPTLSDFEPTPIVAYEIATGGVTSMFLGAPQQSLVGCPTAYP
jgi:P22_AR N-terminal domain